MTSAALLVTDYIFSRTTAIATASCLGAMFVAFWAVLALYLRSR
jgi:hypothetical protein